MPPSPQTRPWSSPTSPAPELPRVFRLLGPAPPGPGPSARCRLPAALRLVIPPGSLMGRLAALMDIDQVLPVYASVAEAMAAEADADLAASPAGAAVTVAGIT